MRRASEKRDLIVAALERACRAGGLSQLLCHITCDEAAVRYAPSTSRISDFTGVTVGIATIRSVLLAEHLQGRILRDQSHAHGQIRWWPVGLWEKLRQERDYQKGGDV